MIFSGHVLAEVEQVADRVAIMRKGRLMHVENMHTRRNLRLLLVNFERGVVPPYPEELEMTVREQNGDATLFEHRGEIAPLLSWLGSVSPRDVRIGTEDLRTLYDKYHGPDVPDEEVPV